MSFDPLKYLNLHLSQEVKGRASHHLLDQLSQYLIIRTVELIPEHELSRIESVESLFAKASESIPDYNGHVWQFIDDFKKEYSKNAGVY